MAEHDAKVMPHAGIDPGALRAGLAEHGWVTVTGMPCLEGNRPLLDLAAGLGTVNPYGAGEQSHDGAGVHRVTLVAQAVLDATGKPMLSKTAADFALHTDESFAPVPSRYVLLHCWREDVNGGETLLARSEAVLARIEPWAVDLCLRVKFLWRKCYAPIVSRVPELDWPVVRFNAREIAGDAIGDDEADQRARIVPEIFLAAAHEAADRILLEAGDCLVLDNRRVLHGRTAFDPASDRLLKRVWVKAADDRAAPALAASLTAR